DWRELLAGLGINFYFLKTLVALKIERKMMEKLGFTITQIVGHQGTYLPLFVIVVLNQKLFII
ncbi:hypothetical protein, partial [Streptococcus sp. HMSC064H02]|uniref:hypothetical protein n=1 Tax=Streptococcus sp. HMSC064H02 TaxID=1715115 RepID=UPI0021496918